MTLRRTALQLMWGFAAVLLLLEGEGAAAKAECPQDTTTTAVQQTVAVVSPVLNRPELSGFTPGQIMTMRQLNSIFENGTTKFQYGYIEDIGDGAGVTAGEAGFTGGELKILVTNYMNATGADARTKKDFEEFLPCLDQIAKAKDISQYACLYPNLKPEKMSKKEFKEEGGEISKVGFGKVWSAAAKDPVMRQLQDERVFNVYLNPGIEAARKYGLKSALGAAFIYDTFIQSGDDGAAKMAVIVQQQFAIKHTGRASPETPAEEKEWLRLWATERKKELVTTPAGAETTPRVDSLLQILDSGNMNLDLPFHITYFSGSHKLK